jgi:hypothetical protein
MTGGHSKRSFASRPGNAESWVRAPEPPSGAAMKPDVYTARLTIDITPDLRGRIKVIAFGRGVTVADMLRELLLREFPDSPGDAS